LTSTEIAVCKDPQNSGLYNKFYDRDDSGLYYKTTILANLALPRSINQGGKVCCKLKNAFTIVDYNCKTFILQAAGDLLLTTKSTLSKFSFYKIVERVTIMFKNAPAYFGFTIFGKLARS
jgi:hypothetical protein